VKNDGEGPMNERDEMAVRAETAPATKPKVSQLANAIARAVRNDGDGLNRAEVLTLALAAQKLQGALVVSDVQAINVQRAQRWHSGNFHEWSGLEWAGALCGEAGEAANVCKKLRRVETGAAGNAWSDTPLEGAQLVRALAGECADVFLYLTLLASRYGIDLAEAIRDKFNSKSEAMGFPERL
jgi:NTP pyrophosphatase (non-canonical NTP hydrolase)